MTHLCLALAALLAAPPIPARIATCAVTYQASSDQVKKVEISSDAIFPQGQPAWTPVAMQRREGALFEIELARPPDPGRMAFKFLENGEWEVGDNRTIDWPASGPVECTSRGGFTPVIDGGGVGAGGTRGAWMDPVDVTIVYHAVDTAGTRVQSVALAGDFYGHGDWKAVDLKDRGDGTWVVRVVDLAVGDHAYKFVVDGRWEAGANRTLHGYLAYGDPKETVDCTFLALGDAYVYRQASTLETYIDHALKIEAAQGALASASGPDAYERFQELSRQCEALSRELVDTVYKDIQAGRLGSLRDCVDKAPAHLREMKAPLQSLYQRLRFDSAMGEAGGVRAQAMTLLARLD